MSQESRKKPQTKKLKLDEQFLSSLANRLRLRSKQVSQAQDVIEPSQKLVNASTLTIAQLASGLEKMAQIARGVEYDLVAVSGHMAELSMEQIIEAMTDDVILAHNLIEVLPFEVNFMLAIIEASPEVILSDALQQGTPETKEKMKKVVAKI